MGPIRLLYGKIPVFICFTFSIIISRGSASYFTEMIMLISLACTLAQTRMVFGRVTLPSQGPMRGQYVFCMVKSQSFYMFYIPNCYF